MHNGECLKTIILSNSPPLTQGKFTRTSDLGLFSSLNSVVTLFNIKTGKPLREFRGHENKDYIVEFGFTYDHRGDFCGFITGSENGQIYEFDWKRESPKSSLLINAENEPVDLVLTFPGCAVVSGRGWNTIHKVDCK